LYRESKVVKQLKIRQEFWTFGFVWTSSRRRYTRIRFA